FLVSRRIPGSQFTVLRGAAPNRSTRHHGVTHHSSAQRLGAERPAPAKARWPRCLVPDRSSDLLGCARIRMPTCSPALPPQGVRTRGRPYRETHARELATVRRSVWADDKGHSPPPG